MSIDAKQFVFKIKGGNETFELTKLAPSISAAISRRRCQIDRGRTGRRLALPLLRFQNQEKTAVLTLLGTKMIVEMPASLVLYMVRDMSDPKINQAFRGILAKRGKRDMWIVRKPRTLDGVRAPSATATPRARRISFELEANGEKLNVQLTRIFGMIFNPPPIAVAADGLPSDRHAEQRPLRQIADRHRKKALGRRDDYGREGRVSELDSIAKLDFSAGSMLYLSNADPIKVEQSSTEGLPEPYRRDRNLDNERTVRSTGPNMPRALPCTPARC